LAEWTEAEIERLRALVLARELDAQGISEVMGRSRNSIVGRIHRMKLPSPPYSSTQPRARGKAGQFLSDPPPPVVAPPSAAEVEVSAWAPPTMPAQPRSEPLPPVRRCQWIEGAGRPWEVCGAPVAPGRSWCKEHLSRVFIVRRRDGREG
jgi:GcrA cell cycle regulator